MSFPPDYDQMTADMHAHFERTQQAKEQGEQGSPEWLMSRVGKVTASNFKLVMDFTAKGQSTAKRNGYLRDVVIERITGRPTEHFVNDAMAHGTEFEPMARIAYEAATGSMVIETGFINHRTIPNCGGSPDGTVGDDGLIEIKCPTSRTHCDILLTNDVADYKAQMQGLMFLTGRQWCDFISYDPRMPEALQLYIKRIARDEDYIAELAGNVMQFLAEVDTQHQALLAIAKQNSPPAPCEVLANAASVANQI